MVKFNDAYSRFMSMAWESDSVEQEEYLRTVVGNIRKIPVEYLKKQGILFIPNNEYIKYFIGNIAQSRDLNLYSEDGNCLWTHCVVLPIRNLIGEIVGITGWDAGNKYLEILDGSIALPMYKVSNKNVFDKEKYFLCDTDVLRESLGTHRSVCVTDGVFDTVALNARGIPSIALLGSSYSQEVLAFLKFFDVVYIAADNDSAGVRLYKQLKASVPNTYRISQDRCKDIEEFLRDDGIDGPMTTRIKNSLGAKQDITLTPRRLQTVN